VDLPRARSSIGRFGWALPAALIAVAAHALLPHGSGPALAIYLATAAAATGLAATAVAAARRRGAIPRTWWMLVAALATNLVLDAIRTVEAIVGGRVPSQDLVGAAYLLPYAILAVGLFSLVRAQSGRDDRAALLDAAIVVLGVGVGTFLLARALAAPATALPPALEATVAATFLVGLPTLTIATWLALVGGLPRSAVALLLAAVCAQSTGDGLFGLELANPALALPNETAWLGSFILLSAGIVRGVSADTSVTHPALVRDPNRVWLLVLAIVTPAVDSLEAFIAHRPRELVSLLVLIVAGLAIARIAHLLRAVSRLAAGTTAYERLTGELDRARRAYQTLVDAAPGMSWTSRIVDPATGATERLFLSPQAVQLTGYPAESFLTGERRWRDVMHPDDRGPMTDRFQRHMRELAASDPTDEPAQTDEYRIVRNDGVVRWVRDTHHLVRGSNGAPSTVHGLVLDITEQRLAEDEVRASEARFRALVEQLPGVVVLREVADGAPGPVAYVSPSSERILGHGPDDLSGSADLLSTILEPADIPVLLDARARHHATGLPDRAIVRVRRRPERPDIARWLEVSWVKVQALGERRWLSLAVNLDVTALREAQESLQTINADLEDRILVRTAELRTAQIEAERASRAKSEFLSSMSHELRTPLNAILGFGQLLQLAPLAEPDREGADEIVRAGRHLLEMIEDVLEFSRLDAGRISLSIEPVELGPLVRETLDLCRPGALERGVTILDEIAGGPPVVVLADRRRLGQVLLNLLSNGIRYNRPDGQVVLSAEMVGDRAFIRIRDSGVGIAAERLPRLFEAFETMRGDHTARQTLGLGLALSSRLVGLMGGAIRVTSTVGTGSEFEVEMPVASGVDVASLAGEATSETDARPERSVLYIEDNLVNLHLVERVLAGRFRVHVLAAIQGRMGLELAREQRPNLILLDLHLPDAEPGEILRELKADVRTEAIPVVILSSDSSPRRGAEMRSLGAAEYLQKPLDIERFIEVVSGLLGDR
jgi:PAS domain S-box-containing protein